MFMGSSEKNIELTLNDMSANILVNCFIFLQPMELCSLALVSNNINKTINDNISKKIMKTAHKDYEIPVEILFSKIYMNNYIDKLINGEIKLKK